MHVDWTFTVVYLAVLVPSVILHEVSHGVVALAFGDDTAKRAGRLTLNPLPHIDPVGTLLLPAILVLGGAGAFGYAKPVPVRVDRLRHPRQHSLYVSLAGPATNIALAAVGVVLYRWLRPPFGSNEQLAVIAFGQVNVILAVFNLLPVPPLDGSALVERLLPRQWWPQWLRLRQYGFGILLVMVLLVPDHTVRPVFEWALHVWRSFL